MNALYRRLPLDVRWWLARQSERTWTSFVWRLPRRAIYWAVIRCFAHGTTGQYGNTHPDELGWSEALNRWAR
jgi:hypothetical protein